MRVLLGSHIRAPFTQTCCCRKDETRGTAANRARAHVTCVYSERAVYSAVAPVLACAALTFTRTCTRTDVTHTHATVGAIPLGRFLKVRLVLSLSEIISLRRRSVRDSVRVCDVHAFREKNRVPMVRIRHRTGTCK